MNAGTKAEDLQLSHSDLPQQASSAQRRAIVVLGMHRSGTSALGGIIDALGAAAPKTLMGPTIDNPRGYFESTPLAAAHDALLTAAGTRWHDWRKVDAQWLSSAAAAEHRERIKNVLASEYSDHPLIFIKDPRICRFVPFVCSILAELGFSPVAVLPVRKPLEVARSLKRRNNFVLPKSTLLWLRHVLDAEHDTRQMPRCFLLYDDFLSGWRGCLSRAGERTGIVWPRRFDAVGDEIDRFLSPDLHRQRSSDDEMRNDADVSPLVIETYSALATMAANGENKDIRDRLDLIRARFDEGCQMFGAAVTAEEMATVNGQIAERDTLTAERNHLIAERDRLIAEREALVAENESLRAAAGAKRAFS